MSPAQLVKAGVFLYGDRGWQAKLSQALKVDGSTIRRYVSGAVPISGPVEIAVGCMVKAKKWKLAKTSKLFETNQETNDGRSSGKPA